MTAWFVLYAIVVASPAEARQRQSATSASGGSATAQTVSLDLPLAFDGPPPPVPPAVITRDASGRATIRAVRLSSPLRVDGRLDEAIYTSVPPMSGLIQVEPHAGSPQTQKTEAWVTFDRDSLYVSVRCWESQPERMIANEMRRDGTNLYQNEYIGIVLDTFYD